MKKIGIFLIAFLLLGSFAFADEFDVDFSGDASVTWGADLETETTGFKNASDATVELSFVPDQTVESEGDGWYGHIAIDFAFVLEANNGDGSEDITANVDHARITNDTVYVQIFGAPDDAADAAAELFNVGQFMGDDGFAVLDGTQLAQSFGLVRILRFPYADNDAFTDDDEFQRDDFEAGWQFDNNDNWQGMTIGYGDDDVVNDISIGVVSDGDWTENSDNEYTVKFNVDVQPVDMVGLASTIFVGLEDGNEGLAYGASNELTVDVMEGLSVVGAFDFQSTSDPSDADASLNWLASLAVTQALAEDSHVGVHVATGPDNPGSPDTALEVDAGLLFREDTEAGLMPGVGAGLGVSFQNLLGDSDVNNETLGLLLDAEYDQGGINPFGGFGYHMPLDGEDFGGVFVGDLDFAFVSYEAGLTLKEELHSINNTEFTLKYASWADEDGAVIGNDSDTISGTGFTADTFDDLRAGYITFMTEISY